MLLAAAVDFWRWRPHPEVWFLVVSVVVLYTYAVRVIGPKVALPGEPVVTRRQLAWFVGAVITLEVSADWPLHDIAEQYLYSFHMVQHTLLTFVLPPMFLMALPSWLARLIVGPAGSRSYRTIRKLCRPVLAGLVFNLISAGSHWPPIVNNSVKYAPFHYSLHLIFVTTALMMWMCVCGPIAEWRISPPLQMMYLFLMSVLPTVPGTWLTLASGPLYKAYEHGPRMWDVSVIQDQQAAGLIMKLGGATFLWTLITVVFFRWAKQSGVMDPRPPNRRSDAPVHPTAASPTPASATPSAPSVPSGS